MDNQVDNQIEKLLRNNVAPDEKGDTKLIEILNVAINSIAHLEQKVDAIAYRLDTISPSTTPTKIIQLTPPYHSTPNSTDTNHNYVQNANLISPIKTDHKDVTPNFTKKPRNKSYEHAVEDFGNRSDSIYPSGISYSVDNTPPAKPDQFHQQRRESLINVIKNLVTLEEKVEGLYRKSSGVELEKTPREMVEFVSNTINGNHVDDTLDGTINTNGTQNDVPTMTVSAIYEDNSEKSKMGTLPRTTATTHETERLLTSDPAKKEHSKLTRKVGVSTKTTKSVVVYSDIDNVKDELKTTPTKSVRYISETFNDIDDVKNEIQVSNNSVLQHSTSDTRSHSKDTAEANQNKLFNLKEHELPSYIKDEIGGALLSQMDINELEMSLSGPPMRIVRYAIPDEPQENNEIDMALNPAMVEPKETENPIEKNIMKETKPLAVNEFMMKASLPQMATLKEAPIKHVTSFWISPHASDEEGLPPGKTKPPPLPKRIVIETERYRTVPNDVPNIVSPTQDNTVQKLQGEGKTETELNKPSRPLPPYRPVFRVIPEAKGPKRFGPPLVKPYENTEKYEILVESMQEPKAKIASKTGLVVLDTPPVPKKELSLKNSNDRPPTPLRLFEANAMRTHSNNTDISDEVFSSPLTVQHMGIDDGEKNNVIKQEGEKLHDRETAWDNPQYRRDNWTENVNPLFKEIPILPTEQHKETGTPTEITLTTQQNNQHQANTADKDAEQYADIPKDVAMKIKDGKGSVRHNTPSPRAKALDLLSKQKQYKDNFYDKHIPYTADSGDYKAVTFNRAQFKANWLDTNSQNKDINADMNGKAFVVTGRNTTGLKMDKSHSNYTHDEIPFIKDKESKLKAKLLCCSECRSEAITSLMQDGEATLV